MKEKSNSSRIRTIAICGLMVALMVVSAWITIPIGVVPITLQVFVMVFALLILKPSQYFTSLGIYFLIGAVGLPVFSGMRGGIGVLAGPTGGFLWGFFLAAAVAYGIFRLFDGRKKVLDRDGAKKRTAPSSIVRDVAGAAVFLVVLYVCGWVQLMFVAGLDPMAAFLSAVAPFVVIDIAKVAVAVVTAQALRRALPRPLAAY